jgi:hypothetical protein
LNFSINHDKKVGILLYDFGGSRMQSKRPQDCQGKNDFVILIPVVWAMEHIKDAQMKFAVWLCV